MKRIVLFFLLLVSTYGNPGQASQTVTQPLRILATIKPLYLLVHEITNGVATSSVLIPANQDAHDYSFRPSDLRKLQQADIIIRVSAHLEFFLNDIIEKTPGKTVITIDQTPGLQWLPVRAGHHHHHSHEHEHEHEYEYEYEEDNRDFHIWLDPTQVGLIIDEVSRQLTQIDPTHSLQYAHNSQRLKQQIDQAYQQSLQTLAPYRETPYVVFHDAWHYFEHVYGLSQPHVLSLQENLPPGLKTLVKLRQHIQEENIHCLIATPLNNQRLLRSLVDNTGIHVYILSPLAAEVTDMSYAQWMRYIAKQFSLCLARQT